MSDAIFCCVCENGENDNQLLLCDGCNRGFHTFCLNMNGVPSGSWYCPRCIAQARRPVPTVSTKRVKTCEDKTIDKPKDVYVYIRVSTKGQNNPEYGLVGMDTQNVAILDFCRSNNLYVKSTTTETGSAYNTKTPKLEALIKKLKNGMPVLVYSLSRFSRNVLWAREKINKIHNRGSYVWSVSDGVTSKDPSFMMLIQAAENDSRDRGRKTIDACRRIRAQGGYVGKKPFGYNIVRVDGVRKLKENPLEQSIMRKLRDIRKTIPLPPQFSSRRNMFIPGREEWLLNKMLAIAMKKYNRYVWGKQMISDVLYDTVRGSNDVIPSEPTADLLDVIEEIESDQIDVSDVSDVYIVKKIKGIYSKGGYHFLVSWSGGEADTLEPVDQMYEDVPEMVERFLNKSSSKHAVIVKYLLFPQMEVEEDDSEDSEDELIVD